MSKVSLGPTTLLCPAPVVLVGTEVDGRPDFMTVAWVGVANSEPPMIAVAIRHQRHTHLGIQQNGTFSVNIPSLDLVKETDYCGTTPGARVDKTLVCQFTLFYGKTARAPLIEQCPVNLECRVFHLLDLGSHSLVVGRVEETHVTEDCLTDGKPDIGKIRPFVFSNSGDRQYVALGEVIANAFHIGRELRTRE